MDAPRTIDSGLRAVFLRERTTLLRFLAARLGSVDEAEDALQDAWLKLDGAVLGPVANPVSYLFRMVHNMALDRRRTALSRSIREAHWLDAQPTAIERPDAEAALLARQRLDQVEAALAALPENVGRAFRMFRLEGVPQRQIARAMGVSLNVVEKLLQRAYRRLHDHGREEEAAVPTARPHFVSTERSR